MFDNAFWRHHPSLSHPEPDDDYLEEQEDENETYFPEDDDTE